MSEASDRNARALLTGLARSIAVIALAAASARVMGLNPTGAGFVILVGVLFVASRQPLIVSSAAALLATLTYNFFFFPPTGTFVIEDPENWIALVTFLLTSLLANRLLVRERHQAEEARRSRGGIEALYAMSVDLLSGRGAMEQIGAAAVSYLERIGAASGGVILFGSSPQQQRVLVWTGEPHSDEVEDIAAGVGRHGRTTDIPSRFGHDVCLPMILGGRTRGAFFVRGRLATPSALESAANLLAFAIEREQFLEERAHVEALRQSNELRTSMLQAVSHDLKSPLTVLAVESEALARRGAGGTEETAHVRKIRDEVGRLHRRIDNLLSVARLESGLLTPSAEPTPTADLFRAARESLPTITGVRKIRTAVEPDTPDALVDPSLALEVVVNLIENAHGASPAGEDLELHAGPSGEVPGRVWIEVLDRGAGLPPERARSLRTADVAGVGLGIELARSLAMLSGGSVEWFARPGGGTVARFDVAGAPAAAGEVE